MSLSRRDLMLGAGALVVLGGGFGAVRYFSGGGTVETGMATAAAQTSDELLVPGPLGERTLGDENAPVTVIEYASMTCGHCATFHTQIYPQLKSEYIDTGKVHFIFREFPLDPVATAAFMLARCVDDDRYFALVDALFEQQRSWAYSQDPEEGLFQMARQAGFTREKFETCLTNQEILDGVNWVKERAAAEFDVRSTPTFFVNGEIVRGALPFEQFEEIIERHLEA